jgi:hypothetical protein
LSASSPGGGGGGGGGGGSPSARFRGRGRAKWNMHSQHSQQRFYHHQHQQSNMSFNNNSGGNNYGEYSGFGSGLSPYNNSRNSFSPRRRVGCRIFAALSIPHFDQFQFFSFNEEEVQAE